MVIKKFKSHDKAAKIAIFLIVLAAVLRMVIAAYTIEGGDPCYHASVARFIGRNFTIPAFEYLGREVFAHEPLFHIIAGFFYTVFGLFGHGNLGIHLASALLGSGVVMLTYLICRKFFDKYVTLFAVIFVAFLPLEIYQSTTAHIDIAAAFFSLLSLYLLVENRLYFASVSFGLAMLSRITSIFSIPLLAYVLFKNYRKNFIGKSLVFFLIAFLVASPWYIRNEKLLGNPIWPFLNDHFDGKYKTSHDFKPDKMGQILDFKDAYLEVELALFGVPDGKYQNLFLFDDKILEAAILVWFVFTLMVFLPFVLIFRKKYFKDKNINMMWLGFLPYLFFLYFYQYDYANTSTRYLLAGIPFMAILWAIGVNEVFRLNRKIVIVFLLIFVVFFSLSEAIKTAVISHQWNSLKKDFEWIELNTKKDALFIIPGQCLGYRIDRNVFPARGSGYNLVPSLDPPIEVVDYILNMNNTVQTSIKNDALDYYMPYFQKVYENSKTKVTIYKNKKK